MYERGFPASPSLAGVFVIVPAAVYVFDLYKPEMPVLGLRAPYRAVLLAVVVGKGRHRCGGLRG